MAGPRSRKRAAAEAGGSSRTARPAPARRRTAAPENFAGRRNLWENIDKIKEFNWNFQNLEKALEEGGELYGKTVYLFANTEPQQLHVNGEQKIVLVPTVVAVDCPCAPSDKVGINSVQRAYEEILPMRAMKMSWVPYVPLEDRLSRIEGLKTKIFTLHCTQRRSALKHLKLSESRSLTTACHIICRLFLLKRTMIQLSISYIL